MNFNLEATALIVALAICMSIFANLLKVKPLSAASVATALVTVTVLGWGDFEHTIKSFLLSVGILVITHSFSMMIFGYVGRRKK